MRESGRRSRPGPDRVGRRGRLLGPEPGRPAAGGEGGRVERDGEGRSRFRFRFRFRPAAGRRRSAKNRRTASVGRNDAQPTSMIGAKVHIPRKAPMPACSRTDPAKTRERSLGRQTRTANESSHKMVTWVARLRNQGCEASQVMSSDWYSRCEGQPHGLATPPGLTLELGDPGKEVDPAHVRLGIRRIARLAEARGAGRGLAPALGAQPAMDRAGPARSARWPGRASA